MTAEERMAYFQGEKRRVSAPARGEERKESLLILKIKFLICALLFILFLSLDYTKASIRGITSADIVDTVTGDFTADAQFWRKLLN